MNKFFTTLLLVLLSTNLLAQDITTLPRTIHEGIECYVYTVEPKEGVFAVARKFGLTQSDILELNPTAGSGLKIGQKLYLPVKDLSTGDSGVDFITHNVTAGQTIYSLSRKYGVSQDELLKYNSFLKDGLKAGQTLRIPLKLKAEEPIAAQAEPEIIKPDLPEVVTQPTDGQKVKAQTTDTTKQRILFFGDSMIETLGKRMRQYAYENGHDVLNVIWYSSSTKWWAQHIDTLSYFINDFQPTCIFICLGANELFVKDLQQRDKWTKQILKRIGNTPYFWIGPPNWKEDTGINDIIQQNVGNERFFLSKRLQFRRTKDGVHVTTSSAAEWLDAAIEYFDENAPQKIVLRTPKDNTKMRGKNVLLQPLRK